MKFIQTQEAAASALKLALDFDLPKSDFSWINTNLAHALLFQGKFEEAKAIYQQYKNQPYPQEPGKTFGELFLKDLDELEKAGITHPDVAKIRKVLTE